MQLQDIERIAKYQNDNWYVHDGYITELDIVNNVIVVNGEEFNLNNLSSEQAFRRLNINGTRKDFSSEDDQPILQQAVDWAIGTRQKTKSRIIYDVNTNEAKCVKSERYNPVGNYQILQHSLRKFEDNFTPKHSYINDKRMYLSFGVVQSHYIVPKNAKVGDEIGFGAQVWNSDVGLSSLSVGQFMLRLACTNGMISRETINIERLIHTRSDLFYKFKEKLDYIVEPRKMIDIISRAMGRPAIVEKFEDFSKIVPQIPERHHEGIIDAHKIEPIGVSADGVNGWGIYNAITRYNSHIYQDLPIYDPFESQKLLSAANHILT